MAADFKTTDHKIAILRPTSQVQTLKEYGLESNDPFLVKDGKYVFTAERILPIPPADAYASPQAFAKGIQDWVKAVEAFEQADIIVGKKNTVTRTWPVVTGKDEDGKPLTPLAFLKQVIERGLSLAHQAEMGVELRDKAEAAAKAAGMTAKASAPKAKRAKADEEF